MSTTSQTPPPESSPPPRPRWYNYWPKWRRLMMGGALVLLFGSLINAITDVRWVTDWVPNASFIIGYGLLAWGFFQAMADRRLKQEWTGESKDGWTHPEAEKTEDNA